MNASEIILDRRTLLKAAGVAGGTAAIAPLLGGLFGSLAHGQTATDTASQLQRLAVELEFDPQRIFRYVADEIGYDPYPGAMRGVNGTLWSRAANSADQALLLAALLDEAQTPYRFAIGALDESVASGMLAASAIDVAQAAERAASTLLSPNVATAWSGQGAWKRAPELDGLLSEARERADASVDMIVTALTAAGVNLATIVNPLPEVERGQHVWIQVASGPDWLDLDPSVPDAQSGVAYATLDRTVSELPDDLYQTITFRSTAEVVQGGAPVRKELLSHTLRAADLVGVPIALVHPTAEWLGIAAAISGEQQYAPTLLVGTQVLEGSTFGLSTGGGAGGVFDDPGSIEGQAIGEWLSVDLNVPGRPVRHAERSVFDRISPEQRATGTVDVSTIGPIELVDLGEDIKAEYLPLSGFISVAVTTAPVPWQYFDQDKTGDADQLALQGQVAHAFSYLRDLLRLDAIGDRATPRYVDDEPGITAFWAAATAPPENGLAHLAATVDILHARHSIAPLIGADTSVPSGVLAGAMDHAAERMLIEGTLSIVPDPPEQVSFVSVGRLFELAAEQGVATVVLQPGDEAAAAGAGPLANPFVAAALASGQIVVAPATAIEIGGAPRFGWWEVDPITGLARDRMDDGFGSEFGEYAIKLHHVASQAMCFAGLGMALLSVCRAAYNDAIGWAAGAAGMCIAGFGGGGH